MKQYPEDQYDKYFARERKIAEYEAKGYTKVEGDGIGLGDQKMYLMVREKPKPKVTEPVKPEPKVVEPKKETSKQSGK